MHLIKLGREHCRLFATFFVSFFYKANLHPHSSYAMFTPQDHRSTMVPSFKGPNYPAHGMRENTCRGKGVDSWGPPMGGFVRGSCGDVGGNLPCMDIRLDNFSLFSLSHPMSLEILPTKGQPISILEALPQAPPGPFGLRTDQM